MNDVVFIAPSNASVTYQSLAVKYSAIEPPTWALILAESCRAAGHDPKIIDSLAENLSDCDVIDRLDDIDPRLICLVVYGQNVNAGTTSMGGAVRLAKAIKSAGIKTLIGCIGSHVQALPEETLRRESSIDFVCLNEGVYALRQILEQQNIQAEALKNISGLAVRDGDDVVFTGPPALVPQAKMDEDMPGYAWDLLPFENEPLDLYRSPYWHAEYQSAFRSPYATIQTSIGCQFKCSFCMINLINKNDDNPESIASNYNGMRYWSPGFIKKQLNDIFTMGVRTIRITDEMFFLNKKYYLAIIDMLSELNVADDLRIWAYARIDTVPAPDVLRKIRAAGFRWLCLGIESGDHAIRLEVAKGKFEEVDVERVVRQVEEAGINVMANYIYGLPGDTPETIEKTFNLSAKLNTLGWNTYAAMALPGSPLYAQAKRQGIKLPQKYEEFSWHAYETLPLPTATMSAADVLKIRDENFTRYFLRPEFLAKIETAFGPEASRNIIDMSSEVLRRKIIEESDA